MMFSPYRMTTAHLFLKWQTLCAAMLLLAACQTPPLPGIVIPPEATTLTPANPRMTQGPALPAATPTMLSFSSATPASVLIPTATPSVTPSPAATATPAATRTGPYPDLYAAVDRSFETMILEPLPPVRRDNQGWLLHWRQEWTPPELENVKGAHVRLPFGKPYHFAIEIEVEEDPPNPDSFGFFVQTQDGSYLMADNLLPKDRYRWRIRAYYHSMLYDKRGEWTEWQPFEVK
jgi:hypothetical protein